MLVALCPRSRGLDGQGGVMQILGGFVQALLGVLVRRGRANSDGFRAL